MIAYHGLYLIYFVSSLFFVFAIKGLSSPVSAQRGNNFGMIGMGLAVLITLLVLPSRNDVGILFACLFAAWFGIWSANKVSMTALPQMVALLNGFGGLSSVLVGMAQMMRENNYSADVAVGVMVGGIAFSGSIIAFLKLQNWYSLKRFSFSNLLTFIALVWLVLCFVKFALSGTITDAYMLLLSALIFGFALVLPIGGADMPIVISVLNACSGFAASGIGFSLVNIALIITGALVGASGTILAVSMAGAMNKNVLKVLFQHAPQTEQTKDGFKEDVHVGSVSDAAFLMQNANKVIVVPGYGMAAAGAGHALEKMASVLENKYHVDVKFAIHPVAGRMPGHMNVLLAEANVDYQKVFALDEINPDFETADVAYVIGANDIVNPSAKNVPSSPLYGMPVLEVSKAKTVFVVKRSLNTGYSGVQNPLFFADNTLMLYGDAKKVTEEIVTKLA